MAQNSFFARTSLTLGQSSAQGLGVARPDAAARAARARTATLMRIAFGIALVVLSCSAFLYPLSLAGGYFARTRGYLAAIDASAQTLTYQDDHVTASIQVSDSTKVYLNGRPAAFEDLRIGDHVLVKYDSVLKLNALEILAIGRRR